MATRTVQGTLDTFSVNTGSDVTYEGAGSGNDRALISEPSRSIPVLKDITVSLNQSFGVIGMEFSRRTITLLLAHRLVIRRLLT